MMQYVLKGLAKLSFSKCLNLTPSLAENMLYTEISEHLIDLCIAYSLLTPGHGYHGGTSESLNHVTSVSETPQHLNL